MRTTASSSRQGHFARRAGLRTAAITALVFAGLAGSASACPKCRLGAAAVTGFGTGTALPGEEEALAETGTTGDGVGAESDAAATQPHLSTPSHPHRGPIHPFQISGGVGVTTAYYHRGYLQEDQGVIAQPYLTLALTAYDKDGVTVTPYVSWWNSLHSEHTFTDGDKDLWYESEVMAGAVVARGPLSLDVKYTLFTYPNGALSQIDEIGAKLSYDFASLWRKPHEPANFVLLGWVAVDKELSDHNDPPVPASASSVSSQASGNSATAGQSNLPRPTASRPRVAYQKPAGGDVSVAHAPIFHQPDPGNGGAGAEAGFDTTGQGTYIELGLEPSIRTKLGKTELGLSFPVILGLGAGDYYQEAGGDNDPLGYLQAGVVATVPLAMPGDAKWYLTASVNYLHLFADSIQFANYGQEDEVIGAIGIGFSY